MARDYQPVIQFVHHILYKGDGRGQLLKFPHGIVSEDLVGISNHFVLATGRRFSLPAPSQDEI